MQRGQGVFGVSGVRQKGQAVGCVRVTVGGSQRAFIGRTVTQEAGES